MSFQSTTGQILNDFISFKENGKHASALRVQYKFTPNIIFKGDGIRFGP